MSEPTQTEEAGEWRDPVIEAYKKDIDRTLIRANLRLTPDQRLRNLQAAVRDLEELRGAARRAAKKE